MILLRRRAEAFAAALQAGTSPEPELAALVGLARSIPVVPVVLPDAARVAIRERVMIAAESKPWLNHAVERQPVRASGWLGQRGIALAAGAAALALVVAGVGVGASRSLPGSPLYGVQQAAEVIQLDLAAGPVAKGRRELQFADTRLVQLAELTSGGNEAGVAGELRQLRAEVSAANHDLGGYYARTGQSWALRLLTGAVSHQEAVLAGLLARLPAAASAAGAATLATLASVLQHGRALLTQPGTCLAGRGGPTSCQPSSGSRTGTPPAQPTQASTPPSSPPASPGSTPTPLPSLSSQPSPAPTPSTGLGGSPLPVPSIGGSPLPTTGLAGSPIPLHQSMLP